MGTWDQIYQNFRQGGEAWASLADGLEPRFVRLVESRRFPLRRALDVGCGTGKYLAYLAVKGFSVEGIDSSPTAIELARQALPPEAELRVADMFAFVYPIESFDLVISVAALHHGFKNQAEEAVERIHQTLVPGGLAWITLPDLAAAQQWETFKNHQPLAEGTYAPILGPEKGLPHCFFSAEEIESLFGRFSTAEKLLDERGRWLITAEK